MMAFSWSDERDKVAPALVKAVEQMPNLTRGNTADAGTYSYKYADLADHLDAIRPILARHELAVLQPPSNTDSGAPVVSTIILHSSGQYLASTLSVKPTRPDPQSVGSAISYARRYALAATLSIATEDDDGASASRAPLPEKPQLIDESEVATFRGACHDRGVDEQGMYEIVAAATNGRTKNPAMVHDAEQPALRQAFAKWLKDHPMPKQEAPE
jgi:hypothetical protein